MNEEPLIKVNKVSKKFSKDFKTSLKYGFFDAANEIFGKEKSNELRKSEFWAVKDISFEVKRGESIGLIGHNGAGKSTLLKMLNGLIKPDEGSIEMRGKIGALIELGAGFNPILTGRENIYINAAVLGFDKKQIKEKFQSIIDFSEIGDFIDTPVQNYSSGMKVRLGFAIAAQMEPDVLIIDEVLAVGDTGFKIKCFNRIAELKEKCAVIFVSHSMPQVSRICNKAIYMSRGKMQYNGDNLSQAIEAYYNSFDTEKIESNFIKANIEIKNVFVSNQNGIEKINHNDDFVLKFSLTNKSNQQIDSFSIIIFDKDYRAVASSVASIKEFDLKKENGLIMTIPKIQLGVGTYFVSLHFFKAINTDIRGKVVEQFQNIVSFKIYNSPMVSSASFQLLNKIQLKQD